MINLGQLVQMVSSVVSNATATNTNRYCQTPIFRHPFFLKTVFFSKIQYVLVAPLKIPGGMSKFGIYVIMKSSLQF
jgi:hypothetical protein